MEFKVKRDITLPVLKIKPNAGPRYFRLESALYKGEKLDDSKEAATLVVATDLETGEHGVVIASSIMEKDLRKHFPDDSYNGKSLRIVVTRDTSKKYNHVSLAELEDAPEPPEFDAAAAAAVNASREGEVKGEAVPSSGVSLDEAAAAAEAARAEAEAATPASRGRRR